MNEPMRKNFYQRQSVSHSHRHRPFNKARKQFTVFGCARVYVLQLLMLTVDWWVLPVPFNWVTRDSHRHWAFKLYLFKFVFVVRLNSFLSSFPVIKNRGKEKRFHPGGKGCLIHKICLKWKIGLACANVWNGCASAHWINYALPSWPHNDSWHTVVTSPWRCHSFHFDFICPSWKICASTLSRNCAANSCSVQHASK